MCVFVSNRDRVDSILAQIYKYWWGFTTFLEYFVTAPSSSGHDPLSQRVNRLWQAIFENLVIEEQLFLYSNQKLGRLYQEPLCRQIHRELEDLTRLKQEDGTSIPGRLR